MKPFTDLDLARSYHGHLGPYLIIGIKMGNRAVAELAPETCFQLSCEVRCPEAPPPSCVIDGIQLSTGCTMGKGNISHTVTPNGVSAVFTNKATGQSVCLMAREEFVSQATEWLREFGEEKASLMCWETASDEVLTTCDS
ncbi:MAG: formylmethanofuran dehydrogenase subunit E family protein [Armatimonadetes bacterium]|nr:formylmethanofuran dehydrogenase subunit E family protein [Armatimonadota bacterium]